MIQQNYFQICIQQDLSAKSFFPCSNLTSNLLFGAKLLDYRDYNYKMPTYNN